MVPFSNGRREGANPFSHVTELPDFRILKTNFVDQLCCFKLGISISSSRTHVSDDRSHPYRKDRWRIHFIFVVFQVERETVMTTRKAEFCRREKREENCQFPRERERKHKNGVATNLFCTGVIGHSGHMFLN